MATDNHPLLFIQMKDGPVDKVVVGKSAARAVVTIAVLHYGGSAAGELAVTVLDMLRRAMG